MTYSPDDNANDESYRKKDTIKRVTIGFRPHDIENITRFSELSDASNSAHAVSLALSLARYFAEVVARGEEILVRNRDRETERVTIPYLRTRE
jgi:hypothetical protein